MDLTPEDQLEMEFQDESAHRAEADMEAKDAERDALESMAHDAGEDFPPMPE